MSENNDKDAALARLGKLYAKRRGAFQDGTRTSEETPDFVPNGVEQRAKTTKVVGTSPELPDDLRKWPSVPRYLVAELERRNIVRRIAVEAVKDAWIAAGGAP